MYPSIWVYRLVCVLVMLLTLCYVTSHKWNTRVFRILNFGRSFPILQGNLNSSLCSTLYIVLSFIHTIPWQVYLRSPSTKQHDSQMSMPCWPFDIHQSSQIKYHILRSRVPTFSDWQIYLTFPVFFSFPVFKNFFFTKSTTIFAEFHWQIFPIFPV